MRVFKSVFTDRKTGEPRHTAKWYVEFTDPSGSTRRMAAFTAKAQSEEFGRKIERLAACRIAGTPLEADLLRWVETLPAIVLRRLATFDLLDSRISGNMKELADHLEDFRASLNAKGNSSTYINIKIARIRRILDACGFRFWSDIDASRLENYLASLRQSSEKKPGISAQTFNFYLEGFNHFCRWMHRDRRAGESPVQHLRGLNARTDRRHDRRPLSAEEMIWLLDVTEHGPVRAGVAGPERALSYRLAVETGLRAGELASLTVSSFNFDGDLPTVTVTATSSKHRREDSLLLRKSTADLLKRQFTSKLPTASALQVLGKNSRTNVLRKDLADARRAWLDSVSDQQAKAKLAQTDFLLYQDRQGRFADFHSFRHATGSFLAQGGVNPKVAQAIMRHSDINLTMSTYSHTYRQDEADAVEKLPDLDRRPTRKRKADAS